MSAWIDYKAYLRSDEWKAKRDQRVLIDGKCIVCGKPYDLNVHHLTYERIPNERRSDLATLCRRCHLEIERRKRYPSAESFRDLVAMLMNQFCIEYADKDLSGGGQLDLCKLDVIKAHLWPYLKEHMGDADHVTGCNPVQCYFRNRRYERILNMMEHGYPPGIIRKYTNFSYSMIRKVFDKPDQARHELEIEKQSNNKGGNNNAET